ncbi:hypothetical protein ESA94_19765 [Lacibacter luteus]|uniref:Uncharacterized protein n=1 Tax=Lacibacter luteus TaxID=2508719 RepID=A0A4V1M713_9BACT|nr:hypothetical protein [Lacibacter luteus]RXK57759.1 hypothetical protein ESA94_19765 [Lacibacter luteus]
MEESKQQIIDFSSQSTEDDISSYISDFSWERPKSKKRGLSRYIYDMLVEKSMTNIGIDYESPISIPFDNISSSENLINQRRDEHLKKYITPKLISLIKDEDFEFGYISRSEELVREQLNINALATRNWINEIFITNFENEVIVMGILLIISRFDETQIFPQGQTIALAALSHSNNEIKELGVRAFEKWCSNESLRILRNINFETTWLQDYVKEVIQDIEEELYALSCTKNK